MKKKYAEGLTICITSYNRKIRLLKQLHAIKNCKEYSKIYEILIIDNHSNKFNAKNLIADFNDSKIRIVIHPINMGMSTNICMPLLFCRSKWLWTLSDDDLVSSDSIGKILEEISLHGNIGFIKFSRENSVCVQNDCIINDLYDFIDYYHSEKILRRGDLIFISTNVFNMEIISNYTTEAFNYSYSYIGFLIPVLFALQNKVRIKISSKSIVKYIQPDGDGYSYGTVGKGLSIVSHLPLRVNKKYKKKLINMLMSITLLSLIRKYLIHDGVTLEDIKICYNNSYKQYYKFYHKIFYYVFRIVNSTYVGRIIMRIGINQLRNMRKNYLNFIKSL